MSQIASVFECLLEEEERSLKENPVDSVQWAEVVLNVNSVIKVRPGCRKQEESSPGFIHFLACRDLNPFD